MSTDRDVTRIVRSWLDEGVNVLPDRVLDTVLDQLPATPQRRASWLARRFPLMNNAIRIAAAAVAVVVIAVVGINLLPRTGFGGPSAAVTLASGSFTVHLGGWGDEFDIEATGTGDDVSGTLEVSGSGGDYTVDLQCARTTDDGILVIGGAVTESTHEIAAEGAYAAILLAPGTPVRTLLWIDENSSPADSCPAFLATMSSDPEFIAMTVDDLVPINGDVELGS